MYMPKDYSKVNRAENGRDINCRLIGDFQTVSLFFTLNTFRLNIDLIVHNLRKVYGPCTDS